MHTAPLTVRMIRAARLDPRLYEEVEQDAAALPQAIIVVVLTSVAAGLACASGGFALVAFNALRVLVGWYLWAYLLYLIGTRLFPEPQTHADQSELLRTLGFATAPGVICILGIVPSLSQHAFLVASLWILAATVVAVRHALDYSGTFRAFGVCAIGAGVLLLASRLASQLVGGLIG